ncbi:MAG: hypothetical protein ACXAC2_10285 [Candidatus Kariarchaeaceae archaeon]|jgi:hypothetical protein
MADDKQSPNLSSERVKKRQPGLKQSRYNLLSRGKKPNTLLRTKSYRVSPSVTTSIASASVILSVGLTVGLSIPALDFDNTYSFSEFTSDLETPNIIGGFIIILLQFSFAVFFEIIDILSYFIIGWFIASFIFDQSGRRGPYYSSVLAVSLALGMFFVIGVLFSVKAGGITFSFYALPLFFMLILSLLIGLISIPLIIVALIGYRIGGYLSEV